MSGYKQTRDAAGKVTNQYDKMLRNLDDDLMDRLRGVTGGKLDYTNTPNSLRLAAHDRIEELETKLANLKLERNYANDVIDSYVAQVSDLEAKLANCEKYRGAYAECDRIGTQAVRDLEAKLKHQTYLIEQLFHLLDKREETDDGRIFHPNQLRSCRAADTEKLSKILAELRSPMKGQNDD